MPGDLLSQLRAQDTARRTLERALEAGRVHHAYLFTGPDGVGKELAAFGLAQALVCERRGEASGGLFGAAEPPSPRACGECSACSRAVPREGERIAVHPDVVVLERGLYKAEQIGRKNDETRDISIEQVRTLVLSRAAYGPHEGRAKVFIIRGAEQLSVSAANALLKTLEEPDARTHFVLLSAHPDKLLPTIHSRTLTVRFAPLPDELVTELLVARGVAPERAPEIGRLSGGSVEAGEALADPVESEARARFVARAIDAVERGGVEAVLAVAEEAKKDKADLAVRVAALAAALAERAREAACAGRPDAEVYAERGSLALSALDHLAGNGAAQLVVEAMLTRMRAR